MAVHEYRYWTGWFEEDGEGVGRDNADCRQQRQLRDLAVR